MSKKELSLYMSEEDAELLYEFYNQRDMSKKKKNREALKCYVVNERFDNELIKKFNEGQEFADSLNLIFNKEEEINKVRDSSIIYIQKGLLVIDSISMVTQSYLVNANIHKEDRENIRASFVNLPDFDMKNIPIINVTTKDGDYITLLGIIEIMFPYFK